MEKFNNSLVFDRRMWAVDLAGSMAYAKVRIFHVLLSFHSFNESHSYEIVFWVVWIGLSCASSFAS